MDIWSKLVMKKFWKIYIMVNIIIIVAIILTGAIDYLIGKIVVGICAGLFVSGVIKLFDKNS